MADFESETGAPALSFTRLCKAFSERHVLQGVTFDVKPGELFSVVGANGAGKTTLIKCLLDFSRADSGEIQIFGRTSRETPSRSGIAFLPERFSPPYFLTGRDFLRHRAKLHRKPYQEEVVKHTFEELDLDSKALTMPARTYSKGMTQKLGLAACVMSGKPLQVLDEPTSGLDPKARAKLKQRLKGLAAGGATVFFTTHALADVEEICDRMAVLNDGRLRFVGTPTELTARYAAPDLEHAFLECISEVPAA
jgi:ABC-type multidrug transport system ATPase subunit